jgi:hypothetical protein
MTTKDKRFNSPSTPKVKHDLPNFLVEAILINRYGALPEGSWRKGGPFVKEWGKLLTKVKSVRKLDVSPEQLAWFIQFYKITDLDYKEFGLLRWKIRQYFKWCNIDKFTSYYVALHSTLKKDSSSYIEQTTGYTTKENSGTHKKTLTDILKELESGNN